MRLEKLNRTIELNNLFDQNFDQIDVRLKKILSQFLHHLSNESIILNAEQSYFKVDDNVLEFSVNDNIHCPLFIRVENCINVDMIIGKNVFYIENIELNIDDFFPQMEGALYDFAYSEIRENSIFCKSDLIKVSYTIKQEIRGATKEVIFSRRFGVRPCLFQSRQMSKIFQPWIMKPNISQP